MRSFENQISVSTELSELLDFLEVHCSAACCGVGAFEIHQGLLLRKLIDLGEQRVVWYDRVKNEVSEKYDEIKALTVDEPEDDVPVIFPTNDSLPQFYIPHNELLHLFKRLGIIIKQVKGSNAMP